MVVESCTRGIEMFAKLKDIDLSQLRTVIQCARFHVEDVSSGLNDGTYEASENTDLPQKESALEALETWFQFASNETLLNGIASKIRERSDCSEQEAMVYAKSILDTEKTFSYERWRHGGWYVSGVSYPSGCCGCVSNNYADKKWRIVCDERRGNLNETGDFTFPSREAAARAEQLLTIEAWREALTETPQEPDVQRPRG